jgi:hypothetical protein
MRVEARQYFSRMLRDEIEQFHLGHNKLSAMVRARVADPLRFF